MLLGLRCLGRRKRNLENWGPDWIAEVVNVKPKRLVMSMSYHDERKNENKNRNVFWRTHHTTARNMRRGYGSPFGLWPERLQRCYLTGSGY